MIKLRYPIMKYAKSAGSCVRMGDEGIEEIEEMKVI